MKAGLTPKQQRFVEEYLVDLSAAAAVRRAGYKVRRPDQQGFELLRKPEVAAAIAAAQQSRSQRTQIDADWVLRRLAGEADADLADLYDEAGNLLPMREWPAVFRKGLVVGFETANEVDGHGDDRTVTRVRKVKLQDRSKTVELIGRHVHVGAWREKVEHTGPGGGPIQSVTMTPAEFRALALEVAGNV